MSRKTTLQKFVNKIEQFVSNDTQKTQPDLAIDELLSTSQASVPDNQTSDSTAPKSGRPVALKVSEPARSMVKLVIEDRLIIAMKVKAAERKTTAAAVAEHALRAYLKL
ncbi:hypothetical protein AB4Y96_15960 [Phyllobacterium sp. TAF24]|uniref:hypothetical protein n=1 Tax=Phyllobacterium sp. TAF24 TaxID=3233068 RepID=UPI003F99352A